MKFFKYSVLALAFAAVFSACKDETYTPGAPSEGVYILTDNPTAVELDRNENSFEVKVARSGESAAATYALIGSASDEEAFTLPASVSFAAGETETTVSIAYNQAVMAMDKAYKVMIAFPSEVTVSDYGYRSLEMAVTLPAPWVTIGKGTFHDIFLLALSTASEDPEFKPEWECEIQQHEVDPTRFRWLHPYGENFAKFLAANGFGEPEPAEYDSEGKYNLEFVVAEGNSKVIIPFQSLGFQFFSNGVLFVGNEPGLYYPDNSYEVIINDPELGELCSVAAWGEEKNEETGEMETVLESVFCPDGNLYFAWDVEPDKIYYHPSMGYAWWREGVEMKDYSIGLKYIGVLNDAEGYSKALCDIVLGADLKSVKAGIVEGTDVEAAVEAVASDAVATIELEKTSIKQEFEFASTGDYVLAAIGYNDGGDEVATEVISFFVADGGGSEWVSLGTGTMVDGWVIPAFKLQGGGRADPMKMAFSVKIDKNKETEGVYRLVDAWGAGYPGASLNKYTGDPVNVVIDARNPNMVSVQPQFCGFLNVGSNFSEAYWITTLADVALSQGVTEEQIVAMGCENYMQDGEIGFMFPTFGVTDTPNDAAPAIGDCQYNFYPENDPYSEEFEVCPSVVILPGASSSMPAKVAMRNLELKAKMSVKNLLVSRHAKAFVKSNNMHKTLKHKAFRQYTKH